MRDPILADGWIPEAARYDGTSSLSPRDTSSRARRAGEDYEDRLRGKRQEDDPSDLSQEPTTRRTALRLR